MSRICQTFLMMIVLPEKVFGTKARWYGKDHGLLLVFVGGGAVSQVPITWQEKIEANLAFKTIGDELKVGGIKGNRAVNPTLLMRTGYFTMVLTVLDLDNMPCMT